MFHKRPVAECLLVSVPIAISLLLTFHLRSEREKLLRKEVETRASAIFRTVESIVSIVPQKSIPTDLSQALCEGLAGLDEVLWVEILDDQARVISHSIPSRIGQAPLAMHSDFVRQVIASDQVITQWDKERDRFNYFGPVPVRIESRERVNRVAELVLNTSHIRTTLNRFVLQQLIVLIPVTAAVPLVMWLLMIRLRGSEERRREAESASLRIGEIIEAAHHEVYVFDAETFRFRNVNRAGRNNLGYTMEELLQMTPLDLKPQMDEATFRRYVAPLITQERTVVHFESRHQRKDGSTYPVSVNVSLSELNNDGVFLAMLMDQSEERRAENELRQAQKMEAVGKLSAGVAHDFNNLLTVIQCSVDLLRVDNGKDPDSLVELDRITTAVDYATGLTRRLLAFGRRQQTEPVTVDLNSQIEALKPILQRLVSEEIELRLLPAAEPAMIEIDISSFEQIVTNLVVNSRDAMPEGGGLEVKLEHAGSPESPTVRLTVSDTGTGMSSDVLEQIFEPFFTTKAANNGTGLGLSTVHGLVTQALGTIQVDSTLGVGTTFVIEFPRVVDESLPMADEADPAELLEGGHVNNQATKRIAICEDAEAIRKVLCATLEARGYHVTDFESPKELLKALEYGEAFDLVLSDVIMPEQNGYDLADACVKIDPEISIVLMSGYDPTERFRRENRGEYQFLQKPFSTSELIACISGNGDLCRGNASET